MKRMITPCCIFLLLFCLTGCGKPKTPASDPAERNDPVGKLLGTYAIAYEGESGSGEYHVDIRAGETLLYAIQRGKHSDLAPVNSFDAETGTATASFSVQNEDGKIAVFAELTFTLGDDGVTCSGICIATYGGAVEESFSLSGERVWSIGEQPGN